MCFDRLIKKILDPFKENSPANLIPSQKIYSNSVKSFQSLFKLMFDVVDSIFHNFSRKEKLYAGAKKKERRRRRQTRPINFSPAKFTDDYFSARSLLLSLRLVVEVAPRVEACVERNFARLDGRDTSWHDGYKPERVFTLVT